jgi:hypothetical protein
MGLKGGGGRVLEFLFGSVFVDADVADKSGFGGSGSVVEDFVTKLLLDLLDLSKLSSVEGFGVVGVDDEKEGCLVSIIIPGKLGGGWLEFVGKELVLLLPKNCFTNSSFVLILSFSSVMLILNTTLIYNQ